MPDKGYQAEFAISLGGNLVAPLYAKVDPETNYGVQIIAPDIPPFGSPQDVSVTFFGTPTTNPNVFNSLRTVSAGATPVGFLDNPTACSTEPQVTHVSVDSWEKPGSWLANGSPNLSDPNWVTTSTTMFPAADRL